MLEDLENTLKTSATPPTMVTCAQILYMIAHSEAESYLRQADASNAQEYLNTMRDDLETAVDFVEMAMRCGVSKEIFEQNPETLNMRALLFCEAPPDQPSSAKKEVWNVYREAHERLATILAVYSVRLRVEGAGGPTCPHTLQGGGG